MALFVGPWPLLQFCNHFYTVGRTPWTSDQPVARPLPTHRTFKHRYPGLSEIRTYDPSVGASEDSSCLRLLGRDQAYSIREAKLFCNVVTTETDLLNSPFQLNCLGSKVLISHTAGCLLGIVSAKVGNRRCVTENRKINGESFVGSWDVMNMKQEMHRTYCIILKVFVRTTCHAQYGLTGNLNCKGRRINCQKHDMPYGRIVLKWGMGH
jgi:hypothetical protein